MAELLEITMIVSFGISWPLNVIKSYKARTTKGKSLAFLFLIFFGYIAGIASKLVNETYMANWNQEHNPRFVTELIPSEGCYANVSSTDVRNAMKNREELSALVHPDVISILSRKNL